MLCLQSAALFLGMILLLGHAGLDPAQAQTPPLGKSGADDDPSRWTVGRWMGELNAGGQTLTTVFEISTDSASGQLQATMGVPEQGASGVPVSEVRATSDSLILGVPAIQGTFTGEKVGADTVDGSWSQGGMSFPLTLARQEGAPPKPERPQHPEPPFPYATEDVTFTSSDGTTLAGTLTRPEGDGPYPAVVLVSGSGAQDRNSEVAGHKLFLVVADRLTRRGIAVLRYDERGVGASDGTMATATIDDFARDAAAAVDRLAARSDTGPVGIYGHSEGGTTGPLALQHTDAIDFLVLMAAPAVPGAEIIPEQVRQILTAQGRPAGVVEMAVQQQQQLLEAVTSAPDSATAAQQVRDVLASSGANETQIDQAIQRSTRPWFRRFASLDPSEPLQTVDVSVLALYAEKDVQVTPEQNRAPLEQALSESPSVTVDVIPSANHLFQPADTGLTNEYATIETTIMPEVIERVASWINARTSE